MLLVLLIRDSVVRISLDLSTLYLSLLFVYILQELLAPKFSEHSWLHTNLKCKMIWYTIQSKVYNGV